MTGSSTRTVERCVHRTETRRRTARVRRPAAAARVLAEGQRPPRELVGRRVVAGLGRDLAPLGEDGPKPRRRAIRGLSAARWSALTAAGPVRPPPGRPGRR